MKTFNSLEKKITRQLIALARDAGTTSIGALISETDDLLDIDRAFYWRIRIPSALESTIEIDRESRLKMASERGETAVGVLLTNIENTLWLVIRLVQYLELCGYIQFTTAQIPGFQEAETNETDDGDFIGVPIQKDGLGLLLFEYGRKQIAVSDSLIRLAENDFGPATPTARATAVASTDKLMKWVMIAVLLSTLTLAFSIVTFFAHPNRQEIPSPAVASPAVGSDIEKLTAEIRALKSMLEKRPIAAATSSPAAENTTALSGVNSPRLLVIADVLNVREQPSLGARIIGKFYEGETVNLLRKNENWFLVQKRSDSRVTVIGWVAADYLRE